MKHTTRSLYYMALFLLIVVPAPGVFAQERGSVHDILSFCVGRGVLDSPVPITVPDGADSGWADNGNGDRGVFLLSSRTADGQFVYEMAGYTFRLDSCTLVEGHPPPVVVLQACRLLRPTLATC